MLKFLLILSLIALSFPAIQLSQADDMPRYPYGTLTYDTTPITFRVGTLNYRMPANYVVDIDKSKNASITTMTAVFPNMKPFNPETRHCYAVPQAKAPPECQVVEIFIEPTNGRATSDPKLFEDWKSLFHSQTPLPGPFGYELYETGPENARINTYRKQIMPDLQLLIQCDMLASPKQYLGLCDTSFYSAYHAKINIRFEINQLSYVEGMVKELLPFIDTHTIAGG